MEKKKDLLLSKKATLSYEFNQIRNCADNNWLLYLRERERERERERGGRIDDGNAPWCLGRIKQLCIA